MRFEAEVRQIKSMVDGTYNVTLNLPEYHVAEAQQLLAMIGELVVVECNLIASAKQGLINDIQEGSKRKSKR